ncbi:MAG: methyl-accepting chemotaxis protein [Clostridiaceae bacterium]
MDKNKTMLIPFILIPLFLLINIISFILLSLTTFVIINNILWLILLCLFLLSTLKSLTTPLGQINNLVAKISQGDLTKKLSISDKNVFNELCKNINSFVLKMRGFINAATTMTDKVIFYCESLDETARVVELSANETHKTIDNIAKDMANQLDYIVSSRNYINEIVSDHDNVVKNGELIENIASSVLTTVFDTQKIYEELISKMNQSASSNKNLADKIETLYKKAFKIQNIADAVNNISKNTKLLSLNASIEAAKASESGSGFAVVATEIRKLANISADQAAEIQNIITDIKNDISEIASSMNKEVEVISSNIDFSIVTKDNLDTISNKSENTLKAVKDINKIIDLQNKKIITIKDVIEKVSRISENTTISTHEVATASEDQLSAMKNVFYSVSDLTNMNKELQSHISSFAKNYEMTTQTKQHIENGVSVIRELSKIQELSTLDYNICTKILKDSIEKYPFFELFAVMDKDGLRKSITLPYSEQEVYVNFSHRQYFKEGISGKEYKTEPYISDDTNNYCIAISVPLKNKNNEVIGILMGDLILG